MFLLGTVLNALCLPVERSCMKSDKGPQVLSLKLFDIVYGHVKLRWGVFLLEDGNVSCLWDGGGFGLTCALFF